jgi:hypothetical protein
MTSQQMKVQYKDKYLITCDRYNWVLHHKMIREKDTFDRNGKLLNKAGSWYWNELGFYTKLDTMFNKIIRIEEEDSDVKHELGAFLTIWYEIMKGMKDELAKVCEDET